MDGCSGAAGFPASSALFPVEEKASLSATAQISVGDGKIAVQGSHLKGTINEQNANNPLLKGLSDDLLYTIAQMLDPASALAFDKALRSADRKIYTEVDKVYLRLAKRLQAIDQVDPTHLSGEEVKRQAKVLNEIYVQGWRLLSACAGKKAGKELEQDLIKLLQQLPQHKKWTLAPAGFSISHDQAYLALLDRFLLLKQTAPGDHVLSSRNKAADLKEMYECAWGLLQQPEVLNGRYELVLNLMQLLLDMPQQEVWDSDPEVFSASAVIASFFTQLAKVQPDKSLQLIIQSLPRDGAIKIAASVFPFSNEDIDMFIEGAYKHGTLPIWAAVQHNRLDLVQPLINMGADINIRDANDIPVLVYAASRGYKDIVAALLACPELLVNSKDLTDCSALYWAAQQGHTDTALILLADNRTDPNAYSHSYGFSALHLALMKNLPELIDALLAKPSLNPTLKDVMGRTGADWAEIKGYSELAKTLHAREVQWLSPLQF